MTTEEIHARLTELHQRYKAAIEENELGRALILAEEARMVLVRNWDTILAALEQACRPLSYGTEEMAAPESLTASACEERT